MRKMITRIRDIQYFLAASAAMVVFATDAHAANNAGEAAKGLFEQASSVGKLLLAAFGIGGIVMFATGFFKLKQASENPQTKYSEGAWRIAVGAGLVAIPAVAAMMTGTLGLGDVGTMTIQGGAEF